MKSTYIIPELRYKGVKTLSKPEGMSDERYIFLQKQVAEEIDAVEKSKLIQVAEDEFQRKQSSEVEYARSAM